MMLANSTKHKREGDDKETKKKEEQQKLK
jgi:hypothetical protein